MSNILATSFLKELEMENRATHRCVERIPESLFGFKPHPKSMELGYLAQLVAAIPLWVTTMIERGEIDFVTFPKPDIKTNGDLVEYYEANLEGAKKALQQVTDKDLQKPFFPEIEWTNCVHRQPGGKYP